MVLPELVVVGGAGVGTFYFVGRRSVPWKLEKALELNEESDLQLPTGMAQEYKLPDGDRVAFKEALLENEDLKWLSAHPGVEDNKKPNAKVMLDMTWYLAEIYLRLCERFGFLLVQRDPESKAFQGAIGLLPPYSKWWRCQAHYKLVALTISRGRKSIPEKYGCDKRFKAYRKALDEQQKKTFMNENGHWHVPILAVSSNNKGKGIGRALAETATRLCPRPIWLASPDDKAAFFEKVGFFSEKRFPMVGDGGNQSLDDIIYYNSMICR